MEPLQGLAQVRGDKFLHVLPGPLLGFSLLALQAGDVLLAQEVVDVVEIFHHHHVRVHPQVC